MFKPLASIYQSLTQGALTEGEDSVRLTSFYFRSAAFDIEKKYLLFLLNKLPY
jgi:hypothetical protein